MGESETAKQADDHTPIKSAMIQSISAVSLATHDMVRAVRFYQALGFVLRYGGERSSFTSLAAGSGYLNLIAQCASGISTTAMMAITDVWSKSIIGGVKSVTLTSVRNRTQEGING